MRQLDRSVLRGEDPGGTDLHRCMSVIRPEGHRPSSRFMSVFGASQISASISTLNEIKG
jgi:hypothetical protein